MSCLPACACIICFSMSSLGGLRRPRGDLVKGCMVVNFFGYICKLLVKCKIRFNDIGPPL